MANFKFSLDLKLLRQQIDEHIIQPLRDYFLGRFADYREKLKDLSEVIKEKFLNWLYWMKMVYVLPRNYIKSNFRGLYEWGLSLKEPIKETWSLTRELWQEALEESKESSD